MKKKRITYGVNGMMEYQAIIKIGRATLKVMFTDGSMTAIGQNPAKYTTSDFLVQRAIENSSEFKRGRITIVNSIELDEEVRIERNPVKASTQQAPAPAEAKPVAAEASDGVETPSHEEGIEPVEGEANVGVETPTHEEGIVPVEGEASDGVETPTHEESIVPVEGETTDEAGASSTDDECVEQELNTPSKTEVEFSTNQEAKDYLANTFGVKTTPKTRAEIVAMGETYGVKITFVNEK